MTQDESEDFALAQAYRALSESAAWKDMLRKMRIAVELAEVQAVSVTADAPFRTRDALMREWQIRRKVELEIAAEMTKAARFLVDFSEEQENERIAERERGTRSGW